jgi:hypothetical protein
MSDAPFRYCLLCRAMAVLVLAGGIALAFDGLGGTLEQATSGPTVVEAEPIMFITPDERATSDYAAPLLMQERHYGEI